MLKVLLFIFIAAAISCGDAGTGTNLDSNDAPQAIDTTAHPDGMINGSVISTDTAAMRPSDTTARP